jgi:hypothetical protein
MNKQLSNKQLSHWYKQFFNVIVLAFFTAIALEVGSSATQPVVTKKNLLRSTSVNQKLETVSSTIQPLAKLENWRFSPKASKLEITLSAAAKPRYFFLTQPSRIVVDLPATKLGHVSTRENYSGNIQSIRVSQLKTGVTRIVMDLAPGTLLDKKQVQLQPVSFNNPTQWVLRPFVVSYGSPSPSGNYPHRQGLPSTTIAPQPFKMEPLSTGLSNPPQTLNNQSSSTGLSNSQPPSDFSVPPPLTNLPSSNSSNNQQQPIVSVPPLSRNNPSPSPNISDLPPANFFNQPEGPTSSIPPMPTTSNFSAPTVPNSPPSSPDVTVINFGQPFPKGTH